MDRGIAVLGEAGSGAQGGWGHAMWAPFPTPTPTRVHRPRQPEPSTCLNGRGWPVALTAGLGQRVGGQLHAGAPTVLHCQADVAYHGELFPWEGERRKQNL